MLKNLFTLIAAASLLFLAAWGCSKSASPPATQGGTTTDNQSQPKTEGETVNTSANAEVTANLAKLSNEDRALAEKQKVCPVSGEELGSMGAPIKVDVKGQPVFICCEGCKEDLLAKPDEYLAKLKK